MPRDRKNLREAIGRSWIPYTIAACSAVVLFLFLSHLGKIYGILQGIFNFISPVFWGVIIAYLIDALVVLYERTIFRRAKRKKTMRRVAIVLAIITLAVLISLFLVALIPQLITSVTKLIGNLSGYIASLRDLLNTVELDIAGYHVDLSSFVEYGDTLLQNLAKTLQDNIGRIINTSYTIGKGFVNTVISFILAIYFLLDKERLRRIFRNILQMRLSPERYTRTVSFLRRCNRILIRFIACDLLDGLIVGVVNYIFMKITGMPYAVLISVVIGMSNLVPTFGPIAGAIIGVFILLLVNPEYMLWFLGFIIFMQTIDGYILKPKLYGDTLGISSLWVLVTIIIGGRMFSTAGVILAIPFAAISDFLFRDYLWPRMLERRQRLKQAAAQTDGSAEPAAETPVPASHDA